MTWKTGTLAGEIGSVFPKLPDRQRLRTRQNAQFTSNGDKTTDRNSILIRLFAGESFSDSSYG